MTVTAIVAVSRAGTWYSTTAVHTFRSGDSFDEVTPTSGMRAKVGGGVRWTW